MNPYIIPQFEIYEGPIFHKKFKQYFRFIFILDGTLGKNFVMTTNKYQKHGQKYLICG
jgi:hypothetical protein